MVDFSEGSRFNGYCVKHGRLFVRGDMDKKYFEILGPVLYSSFVEVKNDDSLKNLDRHIALLELFIQEKLPAFRDAAPYEVWEELRERFGELKASLTEKTPETDEILRKMDDLFEDRSNRQKAEVQLRTLIKEFSDLVKADSEIKKNNRMVLTAEQAHAYMHLVVNAVYRVLGDDEERVQSFREALVDLYNRELGVRFGLIDASVKKRAIDAGDAEDQVQGKGADMSLSKRGPEAFSRSRTL